MANTQNNQGNSSNTSNRGFASMDPDKQKEIASEGGRAAHASGNAHEFDSQETAEAGRKGGESSGGGQSSGGSRSSSQQAEAGRQSHKNS